MKFVFKVIKPEDVQTVIDKMETEGYSPILMSVAGKFSVNEVAIIFEQVKV